MRTTRTLRILLSTIAIATFAIPATAAMIDSGSTHSINMMVAAATGAKQGGHAEVCAQKTDCANASLTKSGMFNIVRKVTFNGHKEIYTCEMNKAIDAIRCTDNFSSYISTYVNQKGQWVVTYENTSASDWRKAHAPNNEDDDNNPDALWQKSHS
jgi:hypothetical protein